MSGPVLDAVRRERVHGHVDRPARARARSPAPARGSQARRPSPHWPNTRPATPRRGPRRPGRATRRARRRGSRAQRRRPVPAHRIPARRGVPRRAGVHYLDISNELQVFRALYDLHERAQRPASTIVPGVGFGVVATNCLARYVSDAVGGAEHLEVAARAAVAQPGPGRRGDEAGEPPVRGLDPAEEGGSVPSPLGSGATTITLPDGPCLAIPVPTGDLEAAFRATGAADVTAYVAVAEDRAVDTRCRPSAGRSVVRLGPRHQYGRRLRRSVARNR